MKATLRYLLMVVAMVSVLGVYAQGTAQFPEATMQSTSTMVGTGSSLPQAAVTGTTVAGETPAAYAPAGHAGHIRKIGGGNTGGGPEDREDPYADPLGDAALPLALLACVYALMRVILINKRKKQQK